MYSVDNTTANVSPVDLGIAPQFTGVQLIDSEGFGRTATPAEFEQSLSTPSAPLSNALMAGVSAQRRVAGMDVVLGLEPNAEDDLRALEDRLAQRAFVLA